MFTFCCRCDVFSSWSFCETAPPFDFLFGDTLRLKRSVVTNRLSDIARVFVYAVFLHCTFAMLTRIFGTKRSLRCNQVFPVRLSSSENKCACCMYVETVDFVLDNVFLHFCTGSKKNMSTFATCIFQELRICNTTCTASVIMRTS